VLREQTNNNVITTAIFLIRALFMIPSPFEIHIVSPRNATRICLAQIQIIYISRLYSKQKQISGLYAISGIFIIHVPYYFYKKNILIDIM